MIKKSGRYLLTLFLFFTIWQLASVTVKGPLLPSPVAVFLNIGEVFFTKIAPHAFISLYRVIMGLVISMLFGMVVGILMGYYEAVDRLLSPVLYFTYPVPKIALLPVVMILFGLGEFSKITMIVIITVFQIIISARDAVRNVPEEMYYSLRSLGANTFAVFYHIVFPAVMPELLTAVRLSLGTSISVLFFTENFGTTHGMGYFIMDSWMRVNYIDMYSGIVVLGIMGTFLFFAVDLLEKIFCRWKR
ncbi:ABC transporter permease [Thermovenabulum sp.]|uniref:ABC transporter permease n=1 Tax=Thermovenabulum sp. TaxID=3100335 RepID=UPI003C7D393B